MGIDVCTGTHHRSRMEEDSILVDALSGTSPVNRMKSIRQDSDAATQDSFVFQANSLARSKYSEAANIHAMRLIVVAMSKVDQGRDMLGQITVSNAELRDIFPSSYGSTNRLSSYVADAADRMMNLRVELYSPDGSWEKANLILDTKYKSRTGCLYITFHPDMRSYLLRLSGNYTKYQLRAISSLSNSYQFQLFSFMRSYAHHGGAIVTLSELRHLLGIKDGEYPRPRDFRVRVLDPSLSSISDVSDIAVSYEIEQAWRKEMRFVFRISGKKGDESAFDRAARKMLIKEGLSESLTAAAILERSSLQCIKLLGAVRAEAHVRSGQKGREIRNKAAFLAKLIRDSASVETDNEPSKERARVMAATLAEYREYVFNEYPEAERAAWMEAFAESLDPRLKDQYQRFGELVTPELKGSFRRFLATHVAPDKPSMRISF